MYSAYKLGSGKDTAGENKRTEQGEGGNSQNNKDDNLWENLNIVRDLKVIITWNNIAIGHVLCLKWMMLLNYPLQSDLAVRKFWF